MQATVTASRLNIRLLPSVASQVVGVLDQGAMVKVLGEQDQWMEIVYKGSPAYAHGDYLEAAKSKQIVQGFVTTQTLNVRSMPSTQGEVLGTVFLGTQLNILATQDDWLEIEFNQSYAYVSDAYVDTYTPAPGFVARVNTSLLNVRATPAIWGSVLGQLSLGSNVTVEASYGEWCQIQFNGNLAYVAAEFLLPIDADEQREVVLEDDVEKSDEYVIPQADLEAEQGLVLTPQKLLPVKGNSTQRKVARAWNNYGAFLEQLSEDIAIDVACTVAVLCVESSGKGFEQNNANRMIIRFENHKFWKYWGKHNIEKFRAHFAYSSNKVWTGHKWRKSDKEEWRGFHGNQRKEWEVFEFARSLDADAAMLSISMGAPQIMGFHYERIGYQSVNEMFEAFSTDISKHIQGLFDFFSSTMVRNLREQDFVSFARYYNGNGQKEKYGKWINDHFESFKSMHV